MRGYLDYLALSGLILLLSLPMAYAQKDKEVLLEKQSGAEVTADTDMYVIGPEDVLYLHVWKEDALSRTVPVRHDGKISLPLIDEVQAAGITPRQLKDTLTRRLKEFIDSPNVTVIVVEANSYKVYISGQIRNPGVYRLRAETSILQLIAMAGGFTEWANSKKILVLRKQSGKETRMTINYKKVVNGEDPNSNIILKPGDAIIVP